MSDLCTWKLWGIQYIQTDLPSHTSVCWILWTVLGFWYGIGKRKEKNLKFSILCLFPKQLFHVQWICKTIKLGRPYHRFATKQCPLRSGMLGFEIHISKALHHTCLCGEDMGHYSNSAFCTEDIVNSQEQHRWNENIALNVFLHSRETTVQGVHQWDNTRCHFVTIVQGNKSQQSPQMEQRAAVWLWR